MINVLVSESMGVVSQAVGQPTDEVKLSRGKTLKSEKKR